MAEIVIDGFESNAVYVKPLSGTKSRPRLLDVAKITTDRLSIPDLLGRYPRRRGSAALRELLAEGAEAHGVTKRQLEERFVRLIDSYRLPRPRFNADVAVGGRFFCVDCLWAEQRLIVELDGRAVHATRQAFEADRERDRLLMVGGWRAIRVTWRQLHRDEARIAADLRAALRCGA